MCLTMCLTMSRSVFGGLIVVGCASALDGLTRTAYVRELDRSSGDASQDPRRPRNVEDGHWVMALPEPLPAPYLVACSDAVADLLSLDCGTISVDALSGATGDLHYATPYALSIYGEPVIPPHAGRNGDGYGDGRVAFLGEINGWELQLKGSGRTAFSRTGDGRAVLRSSTREFLASEAMFYLGVPTTRALALVASQTATVTRPWYQPNASSLPHGGDVLIDERCAITTRVAQSFVRVGTFELFARRYQRLRRQSHEVASQRARSQLQKLANHVYNKLLPPQSSDEEHPLIKLAVEASHRQARLAAEWLRVGYAQSNFNSDNCLVNGETVDYGPFGFMERFRSDWGMWIGAGDHFSFMNQPNAAEKNFVAFRAALVTGFCDSPSFFLDRNVSADDCTRLATVPFPVAEYVDDVWAQKMGFHKSDDATKHLWSRLLVLLQRDDVDFTIFWRQLALVAESSDTGPLFATAFYEPPLLFPWLAWINDWRTTHPDPLLMRRVSPKYVPREWMLQAAYSTADQSQDNSLINDLSTLFKSPYDEHPDFEARYFQRAPPEALNQGGIAFMS